MFCRRNFKKYQCSTKIIEFPFFSLSDLLEETILANERYDDIVQRYEELDNLRSQKKLSFLKSKLHKHTLFHQGNHKPFCIKLINHTNPTFFNMFVFVNENKWHECTLIPVWRM